MKAENKPNEKKIKIVEELGKLIENKRTVLVASIKDIPASQFQEISKNLRSKAIIKVPKKNLIFRALDSAGEEIKKLKEKVQENVAILFSDLDCFELASELIKSKTPAKAKAGQEAPEDIEVEAGPTNLIPGPAISELGNLGIPIQIEKGKISIKEPKIIVRKGEKISSAAAEIMGKLEMKPFSVGFTPLCAFDREEKKLYLDIKIDMEGTAKNLKEAYSKALPFALELGYISEDTIKFLIRKAGQNEKALGGLVKEDKEETKEEMKEEKTEESEKENEGGEGNE